PIAGGFMVRMVTTAIGASQWGVVVRIGIYKSGVIKVVYDGLDLPETASVGIENATGTAGLNPSYLGTGQNGFVLAAGHLLDVFLLRESACNEYQCLDGGGDTISHPFLGTGSYYIVVDGKTATDVGNFTLKMTCTPRSAVLNCMKSVDPPVRGTTSGASNWS